uniref:Uncharacterized protein n=1 Tax=Oryza sativa subsp. japonica TaxID=39947 RepID=Q69NW4_ORYSJ|nr:hypothetical protein [Oryza sativa Japonica Group]BAD31603.1 hypothetical protein [Oryza sativa Japonica Group]
MGVRRRGGPAAWGRGGGGPRRRHGGPASASRERDRELHRDRERGRGLSPKRRGGGVCGGGGEDRQATAVAAKEKPMLDLDGKMSKCWWRRRGRTGNIYTPGSLLLVGEKNRE